jgi:hypothetical protein
MTVKMQAKTHEILRLMVIVIEEQVKDMTDQMKEPVAEVTFCGGK